MSEIVNCIPGKTIKRDTVYRIIAEIKRAESNDEIPDLTVKSAGHNPSKQTPVVEALIGQYYEQDKFMPTLEVHDRLFDAGNDMCRRTTRRITKLCARHFEYDDMPFDEVWSLNTEDLSPDLP